MRVNRSQAFGDRAGFHPVGWFIVNFKRGTIYVKKKYSGVKAIPGLPDRIQPYFKRSDRTFFDRLNERMLGVFSNALEIGLIGFLISTMFVAAIHIKFFWIILGFMLAMKGLALNLSEKEA